MRIVEEERARHLWNGKPSENVKGYMERVTKYIPAEVVAAYITANGFASISSKPGLLYYLVFGVCLILTPIYITRFTRTGKEAWTNGIMSVFAFLAWAYAFGGGLVAYLGWYDAPAASVVLVLFTLVSGAVVPVARPERV